MLATFKGAAQGIPTGEQVFGIEPTGRPAEYAPGTAASIAGVLTGLGSVLAAGRK
jgi:hypothetical protein